MTLSNFRFSFEAKNTFCISLQTAEQRWVKMVERFAYFDITVTRWNASTPTSLESNFADYMNSGQKSCAESHTNIWKYMVSENMEYALILEDDACFDYQWLERLNEFVEKVGGPTNWDSIILNCSEPIVPSYEWTTVRDQYLTGGYILSLSGAKCLLEMFSKELWASDWMTTRLQNFGRCWSFFPWLIIQEGKESTIGSDVEADHAKVIRCLNAVSYPLTSHYI
jgi:GR25 family glycosyltransferase involved in LPS biosynthesis